MSFASKLVSNFKESLKSKIECLTCDCEGSCKKEGPSHLGYVEPSQPSELEEHEPFLGPTGNKLSPYEERLIFETAFNTDEGRHALSQTLCENITESVERLSLARKVVDIQEINMGELPRFDKVHHSPCLTIFGGAQKADMIMDGDEAIGPTGEVCSYTKSRLTSLKTNPLRALKIATEKAIEDLVDGEDELLIKALVAFPETRSHGIWECTKLKRKDIDQAFLSIEANSSIVTKIIMNPERFREFFNELESSIDEATTRDILTTRVYGHLKTADIHLNKFCPLDTVLFTGVPKTLGTMYIRQGITALPSDDPTILSVGHVVYEEIGFMLIDNCEIAKLVIDDGRRSIRDRPIKGVVPSKSNIIPDMDKLQELLDEMEAEMAEDNEVEKVKPTSFIRRPLIQPIKPKPRKVEVDFENSPFHIDMCEDVPQPYPTCVVGCSSSGEGMKDNGDDTYTCDYCKCTTSTKDKPEESRGEIIDNAVACGCLSEIEANDFVSQVGNKIEVTNELTADVILQDKEDQLKRTIKGMGQLKGEFSGIRDVSHEAKAVLDYIDTVKQRATNAQEVLDKVFAFEKGLDAAKMCDQQRKRSDERMIKYGAVKKENEEVELTQGIPADVKPLPIKIDLSATPPKYKREDIGEVLKKFMSNCRLPDKVEIDLTKEVENITQEVIRQVKEQIKE